MSTMQPLYDKANSINAWHTLADAGDRVRARLHRLLGRLRADPAPSPRRLLVLSACQDALGANPHPVFPLRPHVMEEIDRIGVGELERYLYYRYCYEVFPREHRVDPFPPCLQIEPTSVCNLRCLFCYQVDPALSAREGGQRGFMAMDTFKRVVDQAAGQLESISLASRGEPLLHKAFPAMLAYLAGKFLAVKVNTNATALTEALCHVLLSSGVQTLVFSADSHDPDVYARLRVNGRFDRVLDNIRRFREIQQRHYPQSRLITRISGVKFGKEQDFEAMERFWGEWVDQVALVECNPWVNLYQAPANGVIVPCSDLWRRAFVWWDGRVNPCDVDYCSTMALGNILQTPLSELWTGPDYERLRARHLRGERQEMAVCRACSVS